MKGIIALSLGLWLATNPVSANSTFTYGPLINDYGPNVRVKESDPLNRETKMMVAFDVAEQASVEGLNATLSSAARFLNMHVRHGFNAENIHLALVFHGKAINDLRHAENYQAQFDGSNANLELIEELVKHGVSIHVCGQSAAFQGIDAEMLVNDARMEISAMTAHAVLQQQGYTLNPF